MRKLRIPTVRKPKVFLRNLEKTTNLMLTKATKNNSRRVWVGISVILKAWSVHHCSIDMFKVTSCDKFAN